MHSFELFGFILETEDRDTVKRPFVTYDMLQSNFQLFLRGSKKEMEKSTASNEVLDVLEKM